jgi:hypothetical protein
MQIRWRDIIKGTCPLGTCPLINAPLGALIPILLLQ